ncbi:MAG: purine-nucleoside phosphorylase [bacterium]|nr:purine-nucleoside phosphorylase [bacterium]
MSIHIAASVGEIANTVLLPGDPLRAKYVATHLLDNAVCYNKVRGMVGYTGEYQGKRVSIQGTGMGIPSISIYAHELITSYGVKHLIRVGTCGSIQPDIRLRDLLLVIAASTDSQINKLRFQGRDFAPAASFSLLKRAHDVAMEKATPVKVGGVLTADLFYQDDPDYWKIWASYGVLAVEMETAALYTLAAKHGVEALSILTVSDDLIREEKAGSDEREKAFTQMMELALEIAE